MARTAGTPGTPKKQPKGERLLDALRGGGSVKAACRAEGIGRTTFYRWKDDPALGPEIADAIEEGTDDLEDVAVARAKDHSDTLLIFLLKARRPGKYRDSATIEHTGKDGSALEIILTRVERQVG